MAYSGTVGTTVVNVQEIIDHAARRCGKLAEELTSEQQLTARQSLYYFLSSLINIGIQYWAINKEVVGLTPNKYIYDLPLGANDALNVLYRTMNRPSGTYSTSVALSVGVLANIYDGNISTYATQSSANGNFSINYGTDNNIYAGSIGIMPYIAGGGSATWSLIYEYSTDGSTWITLEDLGSVLVKDQQWIWTDVDPGQNVQYYRVRGYNGTTLAVREWYVGNNSTEVMMSRLNRDDYTNLPNKNFTANQPYQFWFDRTIPQPSIYLWPTPSDAFVQMTVWYSRQIMDVGALTDELEIPQRWYEAIVMNLSHRLSLELPQVPMDRVAYLERMAMQYLNEAEQEERDKSPIYWAPNISVYTKIMPVFLDTEGLASLAIGVCDRCKMKRAFVQLGPDPNFPGLRVCNEGCRDQFDPYRLAARQTERINLRFARPDVSVAVYDNSLITGGPNNNVVSPEQNTQDPENNGNLDNLTVSP
jgi:hypothetical protein